MNHYQEIIGLSINPRFRSPTSRLCSNIKEWPIVDDSLPLNFETTVSIEEESQGKVVKKLKPEEIQTLGGKPPPGIGIRPFPIDPNDPNSAPAQSGREGGKQNQSFLGKYGWYLLIGYLVLSLFAGGGPPPPEGQQEGGANNNGQNAQQR